MFDYIAEYFSAFRNGMIVDVVFCVFCVFLFTKRKANLKNTGKLFAEAGGLWLLRIALTQLLCYTGPLYEALSPYVQLYILSPLLTVIVLAVHKDYRLPTRIVGGCVFCSLYILSMGLTPNIMITFLGYHFSETADSLATCAVSFLLMAPCVVMLKYRNVEAFDFISPSYVALVVFISVFGFVSSPLFNILLRNSENMALFYTVFHMLFFVMELFVYAVFYNVSKEYNDLIEREVLNQKQRAESRLLSMTEKNIEEMSRMRHDMKNHCTVMQGLLVKKEYDELERYFAAYLEKTRIISDQIHTGNKIVDTILNTKIIEAKEMGIELETKTAIPQRLKIDETKLCSLLFNLLDNAAEAVIRDACEKKYIYFSMLQQNDQLFICVKNPIDVRKAKEHLKFHSEKPEEGKHGYGIRIIRDIVEEYSGVVTYTVKDGMFISEVMMLSEMETWSERPGEAAGRIG